MPGSGVNTAGKGRDRKGRMEEEKGKEKLGLGGITETRLAGWQLLKLHNATCMHICKLKKKKKTI